MTMRLRHPTLLANNDRFYNPQRDVTWITEPVIRGALKSAFAMRADLAEGMGVCAVALAGYMSKAVVDKANLKDLLKDLRAALNATGVSQECRQLVLEEITYGFLLNYGEAVRESTDSKVLSDDQIAALTEQGLILSALSPELKVQVEKELRTAQMYDMELDRKPLKGEILKEIPDGTATTEPAPETTP